MFRNVIGLAIVVLLLFAGCAGWVPPPPADATGGNVPRCKDSIYNRASGLCVSGGA